jgi:hypothetical protein
MAGAAQKETASIPTVAMALLLTSAFFVDSIFWIKAVITSEAAEVRVGSGRARIIMSVASGEKGDRGSVPTMAMSAETPVAKSADAVSGSMPSILPECVDPRVVAAGLEIYIEKRLGHSIGDLFKDPPLLDQCDMAVLRLLYPKGRKRAKAPPGAMVGTDGDGAFVRDQTGKITRIHGGPEQSPEAAAGVILDRFPGETRPLRLHGVHGLIASAGMGADACKSEQELVHLLVANSRLLAAAKQHTASADQTAKVGGAKRARKK